MTIANIVKWAGIKPAYCLGNVIPTDETKRSKQKFNNHSNGDYIEQEHKHK